MLDKFPVEVILTITSFLTFKEKLNTALTCKRLKDLICEKALYETLNLYNTASDKDRIDNILEKFESKKFNGGQVKRLNFSFRNMSNEIIQRMMTSFPNIIELNDTGSRRIFSKPRQKDATFKSISMATTWKDKLQRLFMNGNYSLFSVLLEKNVFSNLIVLSISPFDRLGLRGELSGELFQCIKNAPSLRSLSIYNSTITVDNLETLHHICPQLHTLSIKDSIIEASTYVLPDRIRPATQLSTLELDCKVKICDNKFGFLHYVIAKYTRLVNLILLNTFLMEKTFMGLVADIGLSDSTVRGITGENKRNFFKQVRKNLAITRKAYFGKAPPQFLSQLPSTLKTLQINSSLFSNMIEELENSNFQPEDLFFYQDCWEKLVFIKTQQLEIFKKWTTLKSLTLTISGKLTKSFGTLISNTVTTLDLGFPLDYATGIGIDAVLASFPSLESLNMAFMYSFALPEKSGNADQVTYPNLRHLSFLSCVCMPHTLTFLRKVAPNLETIDWTVFINRRSWKSQLRNLTKPLHNIDLKGLKLKSLQIHITVENEEEDWDLERGGQKLFYSLEKTGYKLYVELEGQNQINKYLFNPYFKGDMPMYRDYSPADNLTQAQIKSMLRLKVTHAENVKKIYVAKSPLLCNS